jgi:hypothetical protein
MEEIKKYPRGRPKKGEIRPPKPGPQFGPGVERPFMWRIGEDAGSYKHSMYHPWQLGKAQAIFRKEEWTLTFEEYYDLWKDDWNNRGRAPENMCMTRIDEELAWDRKNTIIITRSEHLKHQGEKRRRKKMLYASPPADRILKKRGRKPGQKNSTPSKKPEPTNLFTQYYRGMK